MDIFQKAFSGDNRLRAMEVLPRKHRVLDLHTSCLPYLCTSWTLAVSHPMGHTKRMQYNLAWKEAFIPNDV
jgi:hypothetical protein